MVIDPLDILGPVGLAAGGGALLATLIAVRNGTTGPEIRLKQPTPAGSPAAKTAAKKGRVKKRAKRRSGRGDPPEAVA